MPSLEGVDDNVQPTGYGVYGRSDDGYAAYLEVRVYVRGYLTKLLGFKQM
jgi:hypothetical protein